MEYKNHIIEIEIDVDPESPREWDNLGSMVCFHKRYSLGDKHTLESANFNGWTEIQEWFNKRYAVVIPLYLYDHSALSISTSPFPCHWDSGQVGYIVVDREDILKEYGGKNLTKWKLDKATKVLEAEVNAYNEFLSGEIYGFTITNPDGTNEDSCWGFYGQENCLTEAKFIVDYAVDKEEENNGVQLEIW